MPQETNLNVFPYFDDFNESKNFHKVLFKPGYPVQSRELTTLQSILQNQIERFGQHFFKEGAKVIPGNTGYNAIYYAVQLNNSYQGVPVAAYADQLVGKKITGKVSGVSAVVDKILLPQDSERGNLTLYINYLNSNTQNNSSQQFLDGESLVCTQDLVSGLLGNSVISAGNPFAITLANNCAATGSSFNITEGVYFIRGTFVKVNTETLILDQYTSKPNYRIGLFINEEVVTADLDESLNDNSQGYNNYAAPGADRFEISVSLFKKSLTDFNDKNFVELATVVDGVLKNKKTTTEYNLIADELARRTYEESGDYLIKPFEVSVKESLNDGIANRGLFNDGQFTYGGSTPSDSLAVYQISPGKASVRGYQVETISPTFLDVEKPRTTQTLENQSIVYNTGPTFRLNRVYGTPTVGIGNTYVLSLRSERVGSSSTTAPGTEIGVARVYDFSLESGAYNTSNSNLNEWKVSLYDIQTTTEITLNEPVTLPVPTFIKGNNSGATAFLKDAVSSNTGLSLYDVKGTFVQNESFSFDGIDSSLVSVAVTSYGISDIKSVYGVVGSGSTFTADTVQTPQLVIGNASITGVSTLTGISTVTSLVIPPTLRPNNLIRFTDTSLTIPVVAKVVSVASTNFTITGVTTVTGVYSGALPSSLLSVTDLTVLSTSLDASSDNTLYTKLPKNNISSFDLSNTDITIRKSFTVNISGNQLSGVVSAGTNETFLPFDEERYALIRSDGTTEVLTSDKFAYINGGSQLQIYNLGTDDTGATLLTTLTKTKPVAKAKIKNRVNNVIINKSKYQGSGIGGTTFNDGLAYGTYPYGTRVQDETISLNFPDIIEIHGIFESSTTSDPSAPTMVLSSISGQTGTTSDLLIGEKIVGSNSGAIAIVAEKSTSTQIAFIYKNQNIFKEGETVTFDESKIQAVITSLDSTSFDVSFNYTFLTGQKGTFYDYGTIARKAGIQEPSKKLRVYFSSGFYDSSDTGDITTVESYKTFDYVQDIKQINGTPVTDIIDIRPRVSNYTVTAGSRSPLEFYGRTFNSSGNSAASILSSDEDIIGKFSFYLGRIDRIYLSKDGKFQIKYGTPAENPEKPISVDDCLEIATVSLPPYLYATSDASIKFLENKRYTMSDIRQLENRIKNLEYYTSLSLLETNTANLFVPDNDGLNRFKSGFFVDNFTSFLPQEGSVLIKNSIDFTNKELRPSHYTTSVDLTFGPVENVDPQEDLSFNAIEGFNVRKTGDIVTLDYSEIEWLKQPFATRSESVTPFLISFWQGTIELTPASDTWVDTVRVEAKIIETEGNYTETLANASRTLNVDPQTGFGPTVWGSWVQNWTGQDITETSRRRSETTGWQNGPGNRSIARWGTLTDTTYEDTIREVRDFGTETRTGTRVSITQQFDRTSVGDKVINRNLISYMRSRNIQFVSKKLKPLTKIYGFFDGINVTKYCVPKLLQISMISGVFNVGETVIGTVNNVGLNPDVNARSPRITFRVAQTNHKEGPYNLPTSTFPQNPYTGQVLPASYSVTSSILNIDIFSLCNAPQGEFSGWVESGMTLVGQTSGARATITNVSLISDISSTLIGSFYIPNPNIAIHPRFETGTKVFTLVNNENNDQNAASTIAEEGFTASGTLETVQENIISVRNARIENKQNFEERAISRTTGSQVVNTRVISQTSRQAIVGWYDPLAQSFLVDDESGIFVTRCDVFFKSKDDMDIPMTFQLRTMQNGFPTQNILPFSEIVVAPDEINTSADGSVPTSITFKSPVYLEGGKEYAICLASNSTKYSVYISRIGENDILTQTYISNQPYLGSLFKSQNASTWEASQWEDLKFTLYRADFINDGTVEVYNPQLSQGNNQIAKLLPNPLEFNSKKVRVSLASTLNDSGLTLGNTISQAGTNATGNYAGSAGIATGTLRVINAGIGYTPSASSLVFTGVNLTSITGNGSGAVASITINNGVAAAATITSGGSGYQVGDVLGITSIGSVNVGSNARFSLSSIQNVNQLIIDNVQGDFVVGSGKTLQYTNNLGVTTYLNGTGVLVNNIATVSNYDGVHVKVNHKNHGMYFNDNYVVISNVQSDIKPTKLTTALSATSTSEISVDSSTSFTTFENVGIGTTNVGYLLIGGEVISYTSTSTGLIGGDIVRGTNPKDYPVGTPVYKYELNGISLHRINTTHNLNDVSVSEPITFDSYNIKIDMTDGNYMEDRSGAGGWPALYANTTKSSGGYDVRATQNIPFEIITPNVQNLTVQGTSLSAEIRTTTAQSISGNESPYANNGYEAVTINAPNYLSTPRLIASRINETSQLTSLSLPGDKSFGMRLTLGTTNSKLTPVIDSQRISAIFTSNRVNNVIQNYATDSRVNLINSDPTSTQYISKEINLENPATSIKVLLSGYVNSYSDIRAFYAISEKNNFDPIFVPFPGYSNLDAYGQVIDAANSNGSSDKFITKSNSTEFDSSRLDFKEYSFTIDKLPAFRSYRIKLLLTSTNQVYVPRVKELRVIALA